MDTIVPTDKEPTRPVAWKPQHFSPKMAGMVNSQFGNLNMEPLYYNVSILQLACSFLLATIAAILFGYDNFHTVSYNISKVLLQQ